MRKYSVIKVEQEKLVEFKCDVCGRDLNNIIEGQEAFCLENVGGFGSIFGDGTIISLDICQHCFKERLGQYIQLGPQEEDAESF